MGEVRVIVTKVIVIEEIHKQTKQTKKKKRESNAIHDSRARLLFLGGNQTTIFSTSACKFRVTSRNTYRRKKTKNKTKAAVAIGARVSISSIRNKPLK